MSEMCHRPRRHVVDVRIAGDVSRDRKGATSGRFDGLNRGGVLLGVSGSDGDVRSRVSEAQRHAQTQAPVAAGDQGYFAS